MGRDHVPQKSINSVFPAKFDQKTDKINNRCPISLFIIQ